MFKRISGITAVVVLTIAALSFFARPLSAQTFQMYGEPYNVAFLRGALEYNMNGTREGCRIYSNAARTQADDNSRFRCGYKGARWDKNPNTHFWWCRLIHRRSSILAELRNREMDLQRCLDQVDFEEFHEATAYRW
jgi:hypothetical protein